MKTSLDSHDRQFLERLHRLGPATVREVCDEVGVTATAVRQRLMRLHGQGLVARQLVRAGRGRPSYKYCVTKKGLRELGDNSSGLALILWHELQNIEEQQVRERIVGGVREALVRRYGRDMGEETSLHERVKQLTATLAEEGFDVEAGSRGALPVLRENNCPYLELATSDSSICELEQAVFSKVLSADVTLTRCCLDGDSCCEFQATEAAEG